MSPCIAAAVDWACAFVAGAGGLMILLGICHEVQWQRRRSWKEISGTVVGHRESSSPGDSLGVSYHPEIEYCHEGTVHRFESKYGGDRPMELGQSVPMVMHPSGTQAERCVGAARVYWTVLPLLFGAVFVVFGFAMSRRHGRIRRAEPKRRR